MPDWLTLAEILLALVVAGVLLPVIALVGRRWWLSTRGRVFDCALRRGGVGRGSGWMLGTARYIGDNLEWYRVYSLSVRPKVVLGRSDTLVTVVREPEPDEARDLLNDQVIVVLGGPHAGIELAMDRPHLTAFHSWTEAGAPGGGLRS